MALKIKKGVVLVLTNNRIARILDVVMGCFRLAGYDCWVTSGVEGKHKKTSRHYTLEAIDFRGNHMPEGERELLMEEIRTVLGPDYMVLSSNHGAFHVQYKPKG